MICPSLVSSFILLNRWKFKKGKYLSIGPRGAQSYTEVFSK